MPRGLERPILPGPKTSLACVRVSRPRRSWRVVSPCPASVDAPAPCGQAENPRVEVVLRERQQRAAATREEQARTVSDRCNTAQLQYAGVARFSNDAVELAGARLGSGAALSTFPLRQRCISRQIDLQVSRHTHPSSMGPLSHRILPQRLRRGCSAIGCSRCCAKCRGEYATTGADAGKTAPTAISCAFVHREIAPSAPIGASHPGHVDGRPGPQYKRSRRPRSRARTDGAPGAITLIAAKLWACAHPAPPRPR